MENKKEKTTPNVSVGADTEQSSQIFNNNIIPQIQKSINSFDKIEDSLKTLTLNELYDKVYIDSPPIIETILYPGVHLFVGTPKVGKSFMMAQFAYHVSSGTDLWNLKVEKAKVLYLALEDSYKRLQKRLYRMFGANGNENLFMAITSGDLDGVLEKQLSDFLLKHIDTKLIIIDTLQKIREGCNDKASYSKDYETITKLKKIADKFSICMLIVHHTRKEKADDVFDMISGTNGLLGAADSGMLLQKESRTSLNATLEISGRDQQDQKLFLTKNVETLQWELEKIETELWKEPSDPLLETIAEKVNSNNPNWQGTPTELVEFLGEEIKANTLSMRLNICATRLFNEYKIVYKNLRTHSGRQITLSLNCDDA